MLSVITRCFESNGEEFERKLLKTLMIPKSNSVPLQFNTFSFFIKLWIYSLFVSNMYFSSGLFLSHFNVKHHFTKLISF